MYGKSGLSPLFLVLICLLSAFVERTAGAICLPVQHYRFVGDTNPQSPTYDPVCTDHDIPSAINNANCPDTTIVITREHLYPAQHLPITGKSLTLTAVGDGVFCGASPAQVRIADWGCGNVDSRQS